MKNMKKYLKKASYTNYTNISKNNTTKEKIKSTTQTSQKNDNRDSKRPSKSEIIPVEEPRLNLPMQIRQESKKTLKDSKKKEIKTKTVDQNSKRKKKITTDKVTSPTNKEDSHQPSFIPQPILLD